jgi:ADP-dependent NAD(P)H-hydrate dehydratase / NAD(P)H-hydrate epimerase
LTGGPIVIATIGSPPDAIKSSLNLQVITPKEIVQLIAPRPRDSNKGMYGHVLVAGGSLGKTGAAVMAGFSALRVGAGLVTVASPRSTLGTVAGYHPELMTEPLSETDAGSIAKEALEDFNRIAETKTVLAIGPGISRHPSTADFVRDVVSKSQTPIVLDADGLNAFEGQTNLLNGSERTLVLTPHPGEMARLTGLSTAAIQRDRINVARSFAREHELILVLKGDRTAVANSDGEVWINTTGNPGMATGGTGDILTGIVAGMIAQNPKRAFLAVLGAVYLHGLAGDIAEESMGEHSLVATDLLRALPEAFRRLRAQAAEKWVKIGTTRAQPA